METKNLQFVLFCAIFLLIGQVKAQNARCDYSYDYHWSYGYKTRNASYYKCDLDTEQANYGEKLTGIDGQHWYGLSDADVKYINKYLDDNLNTFSSIFCEKFPNLEVIQINDAELELIDEDSLTNCQNLDKFLLFGNKIEALPENLLTRNSKLTILWININQLTTLPENLFLNQNRLEELDLYENQISFLPSNIFRPLVKLEVLYLSNNNLQSVNPEWFVNLQNLKWLGLKGNQIVEIPSKCFASLRNLEELFLYENMIQALSPDSFDGLQNLQILSLYSNDISDLPVGVFSQLTNLQELSLYNNKLTTIHSNSFGIHNQLTDVYLENNKINAIDPKFIDNTAVSTLNMKNNICSRSTYQSTTDIKKNMKKCFDNYQPHLQRTQDNSCGKGIKAVPTIIGGTQIIRGMYPWIAALIKSDDKYFCGGTLISNRKVVTAAHCMVFLARDITVLLGVHDLSKQHEVGRFPYAVQNINVHPDWNPKTDTFDADIAVMVLETEVIFSKYIQPICLMDSSSILATNTEGTVIGYGKDEDPNTNHLNTPKSIKMPIHQNEYCFLKNYILARFSSKRTFCGGSGNGTGVCKGDSGSGLVVTDGSAYYLRGIVSASLNNMTYGCDVDTYSIFTNVLKFTDWINSLSVDLIFY